MSGFATLGPNSLNSSLDRCMLSEMSPFAVLQGPMEFNSTQPTPATIPGTRNVASDSASRTPALFWNVTSDSVSTTPMPIPTPKPVRNVTSSTAGIGKPLAHRPKPRLPCRPKGPVKGRRQGLTRPACEEQPNSRLPPKGQISDAQLTADSAEGGANPAAPPHTENSLPTAPRTYIHYVPRNQPAPMEDTRKTGVLQETGRTA